jgi:hypothetical protein
LSNRAKLLAPLRLAPSEEAIALDCCEYSALIAAETTSAGVCNIMESEDIETACVCRMLVIVEACVAMAVSEPNATTQTLYATIDTNRLRTVPPSIGIHNFVGA